MLIRLIVETVLISLSVIFWTVLSDEPLFLLYFQAFQRLCNCIILYELNVNLVMYKIAVWMKTENDVPTLHYFFGNFLRISEDNIPSNTVKITHHAVLMSISPFFISCYSRSRNASHLLWFIPNRFGGIVWKLAQNSIVQAFESGIVSSLGQCMCVYAVRARVIHFLLIHPICQRNLCVRTIQIVIRTKHSLKRQICGG